jgi:ABC-type antimicrobial peptide transport system ATPase subunit
MPQALFWPFSGKYFGKIFWKKKSAEKVHKVNRTRHLSDMNSV